MIATSLRHLRRAPLTWRPGPVLAALPPLLVALAVLRLWLTGTLDYYVNSRTAWIVLLGAALFAAVGLAGVRHALRSDEGTPGWRTLAFALPALLGLVLPARPLSALSGQSSSLGALQLASHVSAGAAGDEFGTWVNDLGTHPASAWWSGQHATLVGFVVRQAGLPPQSFVIGRYIVTCCVVDATLIGFPVRVRHGPVPPAGAWVQAAGTFGTRFWTDPSGDQHPTLDGARVGPVSIPSSPYLSP